MPGNSSFCFIGVKVRCLGVAGFEEGDTPGHLNAMLMIIPVFWQVLRRHATVLEEFVPKGFFTVLASASLNFITSIWSYHYLARQSGRLLYPLPC